MTTIEKELVRVLDRVSKDFESISPQSRSDSLDSLAVLYDHSEVISEARNQLGEMSEECRRAGRIMVMDQELGSVLTSRELDDLMGVILLNRPRPMNLLSQVGDSVTRLGDVPP